MVTTRALLGCKWNASGYTLIAEFLPGASLF